MATRPPDPIRSAQEELARWHATHADATFADLEEAVETQLDHIRVQLLQERTAAVWVDEQPLCRACGGSMRPVTTGKRSVLLRGDQPLNLERSYVVCRQCGAGLFPPG